ncbi:MarR family transcriptional regulator [Microbacteriaceae bacterium VKM Ac-2855]|nr:MarR family transcriptional regulator [Microbacteriaceae bacterium VKM Ac-2855]
MSRRIDDGIAASNETDRSTDVESSAVAALVRLVAYWTSEDFQGVLATGAGIEVESRDIPALFVLARLGSVRPSVLARELRVSAGNVSKMLDRLAVRGYTVRTADPDDARASLVSLTKEGIASAQLLDREGNRLFAELLRGWPSSDVISFSALLVRFADGITAPGD